MKHCMTCLILAIESFDCHAKPVAEQKKILYTNFIVETLEPGSDTGRQQQQPCTQNVWLAFQCIKRLHEQFIIMNGRRVTMCECNLFTS